MFQSIWEVLFSFSLALIIDVRVFYIDPFGNCLVLHFFHQFKSHSYGTHLCELLIWIDIGAGPSWNWIIRWNQTKIGQSKWYPFPLKVHLKASCTWNISSRCGIFQPKFGWESLSSVKHFSVWRVCRSFQPKVALYYTILRQWRNLNKLFLWLGYNCSSN